MTCMLAVVILITAALLFPTWTPGISGEYSVSQLKQIHINGADHEVMIRGVDRRNPIIIFVHGGPGCSEIPYVRKYQEQLEQSFTIVHYDQRGSGKSYHFFEDYSDITTDLLVDDLIALTDEVTTTFGQDKVLLIGHSYGTYIGMKAAAKTPNKFYAYIGIGQMADTIQSELDGLQFVIDQEKAAGNIESADMLEQLREPIEQGKALTPRDKIREYGGAARLIDDNMDYYKGFLFGTEYNLLDAVRYVKGISVTQEVLLQEALNTPITSLVHQLDIPYYFVMGKYDYMTSVEAARQYYETLAAPQKDFVVFSESAHYPQFEENIKFSNWLNDTWGVLSEQAQ